MPFISSIFTRSTSPIRSDPMDYFKIRQRIKNDQNCENIPLNYTKSFRESIKKNFNFLKVALKLILNS